MGLSDLPSRLAGALAGLTPGWLEVTLLVVFGLFVLNAARRGFFREGSLLAGVLLAVWLAGQLFARLAPIALRGEVAHPWPILLYAALVTALMIALGGVSALVAPIARGGPLRLLDHAGGLVVGLVEATLVVGLIASGAERTGLARAPVGSPAAQAAALSASGLSMLSASVPAEIARPTASH